ncbi:MAG: hypothetical protein WD081_04530 [Gammaproteobacteria bacterium]
MRSFTIALLALAPCLVHAQAFGEWENRSGQALVIVSTGETYGAIIVRCEDGEPSVYVDVGFALAVRRPIAVRYRFDGGMTAEGRWRPSSDGVGTFAPNAAVFANALARRYELWFEATDAAGTEHSAVFPLAGSARAIRPVLAGCR